MRLTENDLVEMEICGGDWYLAQTETISAMARELLDARRELRIARELLTIHWLGAEYERRLKREDRS
jgi:hypothetical protein